VYDKKSGWRKMGEWFHPELMDHDHDIAWQVCFDLCAWRVVDLMNGLPYQVDERSMIAEMSFCFLLLLR
jgi:hypothetical protein